MDHREGRWAKEILACQHADGTWGNMFHSLAQPDGKHPLTTEQALRRLMRLGFTAQDEAIRKALDCMAACLRGERKIDNYWEKGQDWAQYTRLMLSAWIRAFDPDQPEALAFARKWAEPVEKAFAGGKYDDVVYQTAYAQTFYDGAKPPQRANLAVLYPVQVLQGVLTQATEQRLIQYLLAGEKGIYYMYDKPLNQLPAVFASKETSRYLAAVELLAGYPAGRKLLSFVTDWLEANRDAEGQWDLGPKAKDMVYLPLSDDWRSARFRKQDCTERIEALLNQLREE